MSTPWVKLPFTMGSWNLSIQGVGPKFNGKEFDADFIAKKIVEGLLKEGHSLTSAVFMHDGGPNGPGSIDLLAAPPPAAEKPVPPPPPAPPAPTPPARSSAPTARRGG